jgi:pyridoxamine 5'-phosphate oxidase
MPLVAPPLDGQFGGRPVAVGAVGQDERMSFTDLAAMRARYRAGGLSEADLPADPFQQFGTWLTDAVGSGLPEVNAMVVSTVGADGRPSSRTVLLKGYDERGFVFYTNYESRKGRDLLVSPFTSLLFPWHPLARQVIVSGRAVRVGRDETAAYFRTRPHGSQLGAWASEQSRPVSSRAELERRYDELAERYPEDEDVPAPPFWGGFRVVPERIEFWQGRDNRLHDRLVFEHTTAGAAGWHVTRLCP